MISSKAAADISVKKTREAKQKTQNQKQQVNKLLQNILVKSKAAAVKAKVLQCGVNYIQSKAAKQF